MTLTTPLGTSTWFFEIGHQEGEFHTRPPFLTVTPTTADMLLADGSHETWTFLRTVRRIELVAADGEIVATAKAHVGDHRFVIEHGDRTWPLEVGATNERRVGWIDKDGPGGGRVDLSYVHNAESWHRRDAWHRRQREHRAWFTGQIRTYSRIPAPVMALALRCTVSDEWFYLRTGTWTEGRDS